MTITRSCEISSFTDNGVGIAGKTFTIKISERGFLTTEGSLWLDSQALDRHGIKPSLDLTGRSLQVSLRLKKLRHPVRNAETLKIGDDFLFITKVSRTVVWHNCAPVDTRFELHLTSDLGGDGIHLRVLPCPLYTMVIELTSEEFKVCCKLKTGAIFAANFAMVPKSK